jgi:hypothetical protein
LRSKNNPAIAMIAAPLAKIAGPAGLRDFVRLRHLAAAIFPAVALLVVVHRAFLAARFATRFVRRKSCCANHGHQNRKQDLRVISHGASFARGFPLSQEE